MSHLNTVSNHFCFSQLHVLSITFPIILRCRGNTCITTNTVHQFQYCLSHLIEMLFWWIDCTLFIISHTVFTKAKGWTLYGLQPSKGELFKLPFGGSQHHFIIYEHDFSLYNILLTRVTLKSTYNSSLLIQNNNWTYISPTLQSPFLPWLHYTFYTTRNYFLRDSMNTAMYKWGKLSKTANHVNYHVSSNNSYCSVVFSKNTRYFVLTMITYMQADSWFDYMMITLWGIYNMGGANKLSHTQCL